MVVALFFIGPLSYVSGFFLGTPAVRRGAESASFVSMAALFGDSSAMAALFILGQLGIVVRLVACFARVTRGR